MLLFRQFPRRDYDLSSITLTADDKKYLAEKIINGEITKKDMVRRYKLKATTIQGWLERVRNGFNLRNNGGRPKLISPKKQEILINALSKNKYQTPKNVYKNLVNDIIVEQANERGNSVSSTNAASLRTFKRYEAILNINSGNAEQTTTARKKAVESFKNAISMIVMNYLMLNKEANGGNICTKSMLIMNVDGSQFAVGYKGDDLVKVYYIGNDVKKNLSMM